ncbi:MAG: SMC-Scp complex subunit ScpB [Spirochaetales bacterium]|nr:MAG: SMC-Scp complex subunit ScpB [Spirochaetales bacterium]
MDYTAEAAVIEAVLLLEVEPVEESSIARITGFDKKVVSEALKVLQETYRVEEHGIEPIHIAGGWSFAPKERLWNILKTRYGKQREERLSRAALETLSIIAYSQPLTRAEIENLRGVGADSMIRLLREKNLIREVGRKDAPGRPVLYGTTREFLKIFRLESIADLPRLDELEEQRFAPQKENNADE